MKKFLATLVLIILFLKAFFKEKDALSKNQTSSPGCSNSDCSEGEVKKTIFVESLFKDLTIGSGYNFSVERGTVNDSILDVYQDDKQLKLSFNIPDLVPGKGNPTLKDYIEAFNDAADNAEKNIIKFTPKSKRQLNGIILYSYKIDDQKVTKAEILDKEIYSDFAEGRRDGLTDFYNTVSETGFNEQLTALIADKYAPEGATEFTIGSIYLSYEIAFPFAGNAGLGVTLDSAKNVVINFTDVKIDKNGVKTTYEIVMFHPSDDMQKYYDVDKENKVFVNEY